jgi:hypothetical protein
LEVVKGKKRRAPPEGKILSCRRPLELSIADNGGRQATNQWGIGFSFEVIYWEMLVFYKRETKEKIEEPWDNRGVKKNGKNNNKPDPRADIH